MSSPTETFHITSPAFKDGGHIPRKHTDDGPENQHDKSPAITWHGIPEGTESLALIMEDIDAPDPKEPLAPWTHWVLANIPPTLKGLPENFRVKDHENSEYSEIHEGHNDNKVPGYRGPCPPVGVHRYVFTLYALDSKPKLRHKLVKESLLEAIEGHIIAEAQLTGTYTKEKGSIRDEACAKRMPHQIKEQRILSGNKF